MAWFNILRQWRIFIFFLAPVVFLPLPLLIGTKVAGAGYVLLVNIVYFITMPVPLCITTLLPVVLYPLLGVHSAQTVASWSINDPTLMLIGNLIFGMAIEGSNLHIRIALKILIFLGPKPERLLLAFISVSFLLSMWLPNIGVVVMLMPIILAIQKELLTTELASQTVIENSRQQADDDFQKTVVKRMTGSMMLAVMYGSTMGGITTLVGSHPTIVFKLMMDQLYGDAANVNFGTHVIVCAPIAVGAAALTWFVMTLQYAPGYVSQLWKKRLTTDQQANFEDHLMQALRGQYEKLGDISFGEGSVVVVFFLLVSLWFFRSPPGFTGWATLFLKGYVTDGTVAMFFALVLFIWPTNIKLLWKEGKNISLVQWRPHMTERFPWELMLFTIGNNVLSQGTETSGLADWIATLLQPLDFIPPWAMMILISLFISFITEFIGNSVIVVVFLPILAKFAERSQVNPIYYMLPTTISAMLSFMTPVASNITALIHGTGAITVRQLCLTGIAPKVICLLLIVLFINTLGDVVFDVQTFPKWAANRSIATGGTPY